MIRFTVPEGGGRLVPKDHLARLQALVTEFGEGQYPLLLRLGDQRCTELQPVGARALLAEVGRFEPRLEGVNLPGIAFYDEAGRTLGGVFGGPREYTLCETEESRIDISPGGIRVLVRELPPPVGFRSRPSLERGWFECYFSSLRHAGTESTGLRTEAMGGSGRPVQLPHLPPLPPATRWHWAHVSGQAVVASSQYIETPAREAFRDLLHALTAACSDSLRLRRPLLIQSE